MFRTVLLFLSIAACCAAPGDSGEPMPSRRYNPVVLVVLKNVGASAELPSSIDDNKDDVSVAVLLDTPADGTVVSLMKDAMDAGRLVAYMGTGAPPVEPGNDDLTLWKDSLEGLHASPAEMASAFPVDFSFRNVSTQNIVMDICDLYKPDLVFIVLEGCDSTAAREIAAFWTGPDVLSTYDVIICTTSVPPTRGWCVIAGRNINGTTPQGVTSENLMSTARVFLGLDWTDGLPENIPVLSVLEDPDVIWSRK